MFNILKSFFCNSKGKFVPPYFWITVLMILVIAMVTMRIFQRGNFSDQLILGVLALVVGWCAVYNTGQKGKLTDSVKDKLQEFVKGSVKIDKDKHKDKNKGKK